ncbi:MAG: hypothetical protein RXR43_15520 [Sulfolobus sp.]
MMLRESIARTIAISAVYALIEAHFILLRQGGNVISLYHILVLLVGAIAALDRNLMIWIANILIYSVLEDAFYWLFKFQLPYSWGSEYIVVDHVPAYYLPYLILALVLYKKGHDKFDR